MKKFKLFLLGMVFLCPFQAYASPPFSPQGVGGGFGGQNNSLFNNSDFDSTLTLTGRKYLISFGQSVSTAGDFNNDGYDDVLVTAMNMFSDIGAGDGGAFIYFGSPSGVNENIFLAIIGEHNEDIGFGVSASTAGDVNGDGYDDIIVGASGSCGGDEYSKGKVYVYYGSKRDPKGLDHVNPINPDWVREGENLCDEFGNSVSDAGDINGDGYDDVIIGAPGYDGVTDNGIGVPHGVTTVGKVYVYFGSKEGLGDYPDLTLVGGERVSEYNYFGHTVSAAGDVNGDGYDDVIISSIYADDDGNFLNAKIGKAYVYYGSKEGLSTLSSQSEPSTAIFPKNKVDWMAEGENLEDLFATSVDGAGDVNGDGYDDIIVGASGYKDTGGAFIYYGSSSGLSSSVSWVLMGENGGDEFGEFVSGAGDVNKDGYHDVIIGANGFDYNLANNGKVYIYFGSSTGFSIGPDVTIIGGKNKEGNGERLGETVSDAGDINGDGYADIIAGAENNNNYKGAAYIYEGRDSTNESDIIGVNTLAFGIETTLGELGYSVAVCNINGDEYDDVIVGAPSHYDTSSGNSGEGAVFVFYGSISGISKASYDVRYGERKNISLGFSVGCADTNGDGFGDVLAGAPVYNGVYSYYTGEVRIYKGSSTGVSNSYTKVIGPENEISYFETGFGKSVASAGDVNHDGIDDILVGAPDLDIDSFDNTGLVYLYYGSSTDGIANYSSPDWEMIIENDNIAFGTSILGADDINKDTYGDIVISAPGSGLGAAYVYHGSGSGPSSSYDSYISGCNSDLATSLSKADVNGDGYVDILVGEAEHNGVSTDQGKFKVYYGSSTGLDTSTNFDTLDFILQEDAYFGSSLTGINDYNEDTYDDVAIGSYGYDGDYENEGMIVILKGSKTGIPSITTLRSTIQLTGGKKDIGLGWALASGDTDGDGNLEIIAGLPNYDFDETDSINDQSGAVVVIELQ